jgi:hypothetical protein
MRRNLAVAAILLLIATLTGCAVPGEPTVRHRSVPESVHDLAAHQQGDAVVLRFTLPSKSAPRRASGESPTIEIYRGMISPGTGPAPEKSAAPRLVHTIAGDALGAYEQNGALEFRDPLDPGELASLSGETLVYFVRTRASAKRASTDSNSVTLRVYPAPRPIDSLRATVMEDAIVLSWAAPPVMNGGAAGSEPVEVARYRVYRAEISPDDAPGVLADPAKAKLGQSLQLLGEPVQPGYRDEHFTFGRAYFYTVRSVVQSNSEVTESADSNPVVVLAKDVFPPAAPQELEAVINPATPEASPSIELVWAIGTEPDLAGYAVYRREQPDDVDQRVNTELLPVPAFRDTTVLPGHQYFYRVRAVDRAGNESALSAPVAVQIPAP